MRVDKKYYILKYLFKIRINIKILYVDLFYKDLCIGCREIQLFAALHIFQIIGEVRKKKNKLGLSCAKLRAGLNFSGLDYILIYFDWLTWI